MSKQFSVTKCPYCGETTVEVKQYVKGEVRIVTTQEYINQLSEHTVVVTDRSLDDVPQEIWDSMDVVR